MMESSALAEAQVDPSRPSLAFLLGAALVLIVLFSFCGIFSCFYHWEMLRSSHHSFSGHSVDSETADGQSSSSKSNLGNKGRMQHKSHSLPVVMPGDEIPKFMALPCPCEPFIPEKMI